jgi:ubiquinone/menaquinone biosynthesis C-methylase UbiE
MGKTIHFSQRLAEDTGFEDESFDLIVSHALMHETTRKAIREIFRECHRLLKPGGVMVHLDGISQDDIYEKYYSEWMAHYNNEPYLGTVQDEDFNEICTQAGFDAERVLVSPAPPQFRPREGDALVVNCYLAVAATK